MNQEIFNLYLIAAGSGRKVEAKAKLEAFLFSVEPEDNVNQWVRDFLDSDCSGSLIRHELYERLIFPVLQEGYGHSDPWSLLWLGKSVQNLYRCPPLHAQVNFKSAEEFLHEAYALQPTEEVRRLLLSEYVNGFEYCQHEWPAGILYKSDGATLIECDNLIQQIAFTRSLDDGTYAAFLNTFEERVSLHKARLMCSD